LRCDLSPSLFLVDGIGGEFQSAQAPGHSIGLTTCSRQLFNARAYALRSCFGQLLNRICSIRPNHIINVVNRTGSGQGRRTVALARALRLPRPSDLLGNQVAGLLQVSSRSPTSGKPVQKQIHEVPPTRANTKTKCSRRREIPSTHAAGSQLGKYSFGLLQITCCDVEASSSRDRRKAEECY